MESGLQELKFSRYNQKVELSGKLFLYNALTGGYASVDEEYRDNFDKCDFKKLDSMKELAELPNAIINQLMEGGFIIPKNFDEFNVIKSMHYRGIINNLLQANENLEVVIRVNIQKENIKYVPEFVDSLKQVGIDKRNNIKPYFSSKNLCHNNMCYKTLSTSCL